MIEASPEMISAGVKNGEKVKGKAVPDHQGRKGQDDFSALVGKLLIDSRFPGKELPEEKQAKQEEGGQVAEALAGGTPETVMDALLNLGETKSQVASAARDGAVPNEGKGLFPTAGLDGDAEASGPGPAKIAISPGQSEFEDLFIQIGKETTRKPDTRQGQQDRVPMPVADGKSDAPGTPPDWPSSDPTGIVAGKDSGRQDWFEIVPDDRGYQKKTGSGGGLKTLPAAKDRRQNEQAAEAAAKIRNHGNRETVKMDLKMDSAVEGQIRQAEPGVDEDLLAGHNRDRPLAGVGEKFNQPGLGFGKEIAPGQGQMVSSRAFFQQPPGKSMESEIIRQVAAKISLKKARIPSRASIRLEPAFLGRLHVDLRADGHQVSIKMMAETHMVKDLLEANLGHLRNELQQQGMDLKHVEIFVGRDTTDGRQPDTRRRSRDGRKFRTETVSELEDGQAPNVQATGSFNRSGELDTFA